VKGGREPDTGASRGETSLTPRAWAEPVAAQSERPICGWELLQLTRGSKRLEQNEDTSEGYRGTVSLGLEGDGTTTELRGHCFLLGGGRGREPGGNPLGHDANIGQPFPAVQRLPERWTFVGRTFVQTRLLSRREWPGVPRKE
jgi:hypothetical protein